ncbi:MAG: fluoride efflux transporter FluC [Gaiellaceae bacterium]
MPTVLAVAVMGGLGALARYGLDRAFARPGVTFPWPTVLANVSGSFLIGLLFALAIERTHGPSWVRIGLAVGLLGGFTTFSTFSLQTFRLIENGSHGAAIGNALGSLALGLVAVTIGVVVGRAF